ncbi:MAG: hypothetical protein EOP53_27000, partial [Sphingobacteriales bacterium]
MKPKQILFALPLLCLAVAANSQQNIFSIGLNTGRFTYAGNGPSKQSGLTLYPDLHTRPEGTPGKKPGFSYEVTATAKRITTARFIYGAELAYQSLQAKTDVRSMTATLYSSFYMEAEGKTSLTSRFIAVTPLIGYRLLNKKIKMDVTAGMELAACIDREEKIDAVQIPTGNPLIAKNNLSKRGDYRARMQITTSIGKWGINTGYA